MTPRGRLRRCAWLLVLVAGCSYGGGEMVPVVGVNTCGVSSECMAGADCADGMCIAQKADAPLSIALQVTPPRKPDGDESLPSLLGPFTVEGPTTREFALPKTVTVSGFVRAQGEPASGASPDVMVPSSPIEAEISFTPTAAIRGIARKTSTLSVSPSVRATDADYTVDLQQGVEYRMAVRPKDSGLPPQYQTLVAGRGDAPSVDYPRVASLPLRKVRVTDEGDTGRTFLVRALNQMTGEQISSTATMVAGIAELRFATEPDVFSIEVRAEQSAEDDRKPVLENGYCDSDTPAFPVFTARSQDLSTASDGALKVSLPPLPNRIRFEGSVKLCEDGIAAQSMLSSLPVSLHAQSLALPEGSPLTVAFDATTTATLDGETEELRFCVQVIPGQYDVVATPVSSIPCGLFVAPRLTVAAPSGVETSTSMLFTLPDSAYLSGTLRTMDAMPLRNASIDAIAIAGGARSRPTATGNDGSFELQVDFGTYDVVIKPATASGLPWQVRYAVEIGATEHIPTVIDMYLPVTLQGSLRFMNPSSSDDSLAESVVTAFAIVKEKDGDRAVPIGASTADAMGQFILLLPPSIQRDWLAPKY